jgi:tetratricopeptide (TPR) repeat protein
MSRRTVKNRLLLALIGAPALVALLLVLVELGFVVAGSDPRQHYFVRATDEQGRAIFVASSDPPIENARFRVERLLARPPAGTKRIVCIGDSTCYGHPFDPPVPFANWLDARLRVLLPEVPVEVVNLGSNGFFSEDMVDVLTDTDGAGADLLLIYSGHNEFLDRNLEPILHPLSHAVRRALARSRFGSWLLRKTRRPADVRSLTAAIHAETVRSAPFFSKQELARGFARYRDRLAAMATLARGRDAMVVVVHPVSDYVDTPVEASAFAATTAPAARAEFLEKLKSLRAIRRTLEDARLAGEAVDREKIAAALALVGELAALDGSVALVHHERGRLFLLDGRIVEARSELLAALEADGDPVRATATIHAIEDEVAQRTGALVVDPRAAFDAAAAPDLPGQNGWFVDYCHPDLRGHELLADVILHGLAQADLLAPRAQWRFGAEPTSEEYLKRGGYSAATQADSWANRALFKLGVAHFGGADEKAVEAAQGLFERALKLDERCVPAWIGLGIVATIRKEAGPAIANFERAAAIKPGALEQIRGPYRANPAVKALFDAAGLVFEEGRVVRAHE